MKADGVGEQLRLGEQLATGRIVPDQVPTVDRRFAPHVGREPLDGHGAAGPTQHSGGISGDRLVHRRLLLIELDHKA
jgi:hypothetical protein